MKNSKFSKCSLKEVDFSESDLSGLALEECDFLGAVFEYTNLNKSDLSSSYNYSIHPETNKIKKAKFSKEGISGLLDRYDIVIQYRYLSLLFLNL
jgi:uncharacterized protein YjbI with pentapeptide repeats